MRHIAPIVGAFFRPPAKAILTNLPTNTPISLLAEPDNQHDPNAIKVLVTGDTVAALDADLREALETACAAQGTLPDELYAADWHIGYISAKSKTPNHALILAPYMPHFVSATLEFDFKGNPRANCVFGNGT